MVTSHGGYAMRKRIIGFSAYTAVFFALLLIAVFNARTAAVFAAGKIAINTKNFPDNAFRSFIQSEFDLDGNGELDADEQQYVTYIDVSGASSLTGIEKFPLITKLYCSSGSLTELDLSANKELVHVECAYNSLTKLDVSANTKLEYLDCSYNNITKLDVGKCPELVSIVSNGTKQNNSKTVTYWKNESGVIKCLTYDKTVSLSAKASAKTAAKGTEFTYSGNTYKITKAGSSKKTGTVTLTVGKKNSRSVSIPSTIKYEGIKYKVTAIGASAFANNTTVKSIVIGSNIKSIGSKAFYNCASLSRMTVKTKKLKASKVKGTSFWGLPENAVIRVPSGKATSYRKIFRSVGLSSEVKVK